MDSLCATCDTSAVSCHELQDIGPPLFQEIDEALDLCTLMYTLTMLRRLVREGKITNNADAIMKLPISLAEADELVLAERHHLTLSKYAENKRVFTNIVKTLSDRHCKRGSPRDSSRKGSRESDEEDSPRHYKKHGKSRKKSQHILHDVSNKNVQSPRSRRDSQNSFLTAFGGETQPNALVYGMSVNHDRRIVTLCFRGAETDIDWAPMNDKVCMREISNPVKKHSSQAPRIKIHNQLHDYLLNPILRDANTTWKTTSEYQEILEEQVIPTLMEHKGYKLYVTGHSLGGGLATLFAFLASTEPDSIIPKPVTCISVGSSYVGDESFRTAHQLMEGLRKLRHVRIQNHKDSVTVSPKLSFRWKLLDKEGHVGTPFKHVGMNLKLYPGAAPFEISYPSLQSNFVASGIDEISRAWDNSLLQMSCNPGDYITWPHHQIREYYARFLSSKESLEAITMDGLYGDPIIVGNLFTQFR